ncbi:MULTISPECIES: quinone oxidoreductase family protein [Geobacillus]|jgi:NADPH:quinone reductase|uniref:NADPH quinone oxidoreductase, putative n=4 Tax=Geobacillus thermodenitrificans TaxID=33940 RepID=A4ILS0_GEOTN|nr:MULTISPECIES: quinone oxidoreductase [Geobacillus]ABO66274.1 NADPH quinone oxidoreductase, putative [Geobacillus thermodenitrificans NG80-2]ARA97328.1 alcohol dehydrogenase [Geobacillus thermodenitrificans]ARP42030.1 Quinone oxidoreductase [Geobacillus thermodenitrificans]ATO36624.1 alcohol dehydrogenase [Geobacillus thermodenitrificans]KQB94035.1 alcohol dehydrogenase [Geobacillus sp. PA-3]
MKMVQFTEYGGPDVLEVKEVERPSPSGRHVLIEAEAIGVNYADTARREGRYVVPTPLPFVPGTEVAGVVREVGPDVQAIRPGQRVVALVESGGYAEFVAVDERAVVPLPDGMDVQQAAALPVQGLSAYHILKTMSRLEDGETVLVHAAAGGVGTLAVQLAKRFGAKTVIATASTEEKRELARRLGADVTIDYTQNDWTKAVMEATDGRGVDVALEMVGGGIFHQTLDCLAPFGRLVVYGMASGEMTRLNPARLMAKNWSVVGFFLPQIMRKRALYEQSLRELLHWVQEGSLELIIGGVYPLEQAAMVHELLQGRKTSGKLLLVP